MDTNLKGSFFLAQAAAKQMAQQGRSESGYRIVFSSSVVGQVGVPTMTAYGLTKIGVSYLAKSLGVALAPYGITANALIIGAVVNARNLADDPNYAENFGRILPIGRAIYPSDVAAALMYLVSPAASAVTGHALSVDGGHTLTVARSGSPQTGGQA
jgi:3-oxoacyl-[acyl-carrier protein] reductase